MQAVKKDHDNYVDWKSDSEIMKKIGKKEYEYNQFNREETQKISW